MIKIAKISEKIGQKRSELFLYCWQTPLWPFNPLNPSPDLRFWIMNFRNRYVNFRTIVWMTFNSDSVCLNENYVVLWGYFYKSYLAIADRRTFMEISFALSIFVDRPVVATQWIYTYFFYTQMLYTHSKYLSLEFFSYRHTLSSIWHFYHEIPKFYFIFVLIFQLEVCNLGITLVLIFDQLNRARSTDWQKKTQRFLASTKQWQKSGDHIVQNCHAL